MHGSTILVRPEQALPGRTTPLWVGNHYLSGHPLTGPYPVGLQRAYFAMGCFWGAERLFWQQDGVWLTAVGYQGGYTPNPHYEEVCSGMTGHAESVLVVFDPERIGYRQLLQLFWEQHDPAQGMRQKNDVGTQYRSAIFTCDDEQQRFAADSLQRYQQAMADAGDERAITTSIEPAPPFYFAEDEHQQYLAKHPNGYCSLGGIGVCLP